MVVVLAAWAAADEPAAAFIAVTCGGSLCLGAVARLKRLERQVLMTGRRPPPMSSPRPRRPWGMTNPTQSPTTVTNLGVAMFTVADQDAAVAFYTEKLGFEVRIDSRFGPQGEMRWVEVAPPGSTARLALNPPMDGESRGGGGIGVETADVRGEHRRLSAIGGIDLDPEPMEMPGAPLMFMLRDPDANVVVVVEAPEQS